MSAGGNFWTYLLDASIIAKCVILTLVFASIASWTVIIERSRFYKRQWLETKQFEKKFWSGMGMSELFHLTQQNETNGAATIFTSGFKAFTQFQKTGHHNRDDSIVGAQRAMQIAECRAVDELEKPLSLLATVGSVSPFVGIFGTVIGVMMAFQGLGTVQQASIAAVAPGISEALITTAIGLFAAIPAVVAYNQFSQQVARFQNYFETFAADLTNILHRQAEE